MFQLEELFIFENDEILQFPGFFFENFENNHQNINIFEKRCSGSKLEFGRAR
jgi:hypothetical protein